MFLPSTLCSLFKLPFENILKLKSTPMVKIHTCINKSWHIKYWRKNILFTILKEGKDFNMTFTATHFLSILSAFIRRNTQLGHRLAPIYPNSEIISNTNESYFSWHLLSILNICALGKKTKKRKLVYDFVQHS